MSVAVFSLREHRNLKQNIDPLHDRYYLNRCVFYVKTRSQGLFTTLHYVPRWSTFAHLFNAGLVTQLIDLLHSWRTSSIPLSCSFHWRALRFMTDVSVLWYLLDGKAQQVDGCQCVHAELSSTEPQQGLQMPELSSILPTSKRNHGVTYRRSSSTIHATKNLIRLPWLSGIGVISHTMRACIVWQNTRKYVRNYIMQTTIFSTIINCIIIISVLVCCLNVNLHSLFSLKPT